MYVLSENIKNINFFLIKFSIFTAEKNLCILHGRVFIMMDSFQFRSILDPVVQSIVSLTISLRHKFVKQISAKVTNTLLFFVEKM